MNERTFNEMSVEGLNKCVGAQFYSALTLEDLQKSLMQDVPAQFQLKPFFRFENGQTAKIALRKDGDVMLAVDVLDGIKMAPNGYFIDVIVNEDVMPGAKELNTCDLSVIRKDTVLHCFFDPETGDGMILTCTDGNGIASVVHNFLAEPKFMVPPETAGRRRVQRLPAFQAWKLHEVAAPQTTTNATTTQPDPVRAAGGDFPGAAVAGAGA